MKIEGLKLNQRANTEPGALESLAMLRIALADTQPLLDVCTNYVVLEDKMTMKTAAHALAKIRKKLAISFDNMTYKTDEHQDNIEESVGRIKAFRRHCVERNMNLVDTVFPLLNYIDDVAYDHLLQMIYDFLENYNAQAQYLLENKTELNIENTENGNDNTN